MKKVIDSTLDAYRQYRAVKANCKAYRIFRYSLLAICTIYFLTICFPQYLFAYEVTHKNFKIYSREPLDENIYKILDDAETRLSKSTIYDSEVSRRVFLTNSYAFYAFLSNKAFRSFANSLPVINNILINKSDTANDRVFLDRPEHNKRSLSGVIAHEVTHLFIRKKLGNFDSFRLATWKNEGYCEYIAGDTTITFEEGVKLWKENPNEDSKYRYFKSHLRVKYLIETEKLTIDEVFSKDFDESDLDTKVFSSL